MLEKKSIYREIEIVILDDNRLVIEILRQVLKELGANRLASFTNPYDALECFSARRIDIAFIDLIMPHMDGFEITQMVRNANDIVNRMMPIVMVTGHADLRTVKRAINFGVDEIIGKPFAPKALQQRLDSVLFYPRRYIRTQSGYFGPDRRRMISSGYAGDCRRKLDTSIDVGTPSFGMDSQLSHEPDIFDLEDHDITFSRNIS